MPLPDVADGTSPTRSASSPDVFNLGVRMETSPPRRRQHQHLGEDASLARSSSSANNTTGNTSSSDSETVMVKLSPRLERRNKAAWGDLPTPTMGSSTSFSFGSSSGTGNTINHPIVESCHSSSLTPAPPPYFGALTPAALKANVVRPHHGKSFSDRAESPFRLELESTHRARQEEFAKGPLDDGHGHGHGHTRGYSHGYSHSASGYGHGRRHGLPTPMLRKKSGELVKSSLKHDTATNRAAKSAPATPTGPKAVHFDEQLERVKLFLAQQRPTAVSRDGSPVETETEDDSEAAFPFPPMTTSIPAHISLVLPGFPNNILPELGSDRDISLETLEIAADWKSLKGTALLRNIAYEKRLSVRFTLDDWQTVSEVTGEWTCTLVGGTLDRWSFSIKLQDMLTRIEDRKMFIALKYSVNGCDIWDNNHGRNYRAEFKREAARHQAVVGGTRAARHEWSVTNPGQAMERMADLRRELDRLVADRDRSHHYRDHDMEIGDGGAGAGAGDCFGETSTDDILLVSNPSNLLNSSSTNNWRYSPKYLGGETIPGGVGGVSSAAAASSSSTSTSTSGGFSARYDFGASLKNEKAARSNNNNSPQTLNAVLDNPYFTLPPSQALLPPPPLPPPASEAMLSGNSWRRTSESSLSFNSSQNSPPKPQPQLQLQSPSPSQSETLYAPADGDLITPSSATTKTTLTTPPVSFSGDTYYLPSLGLDGIETSTDLRLKHFPSSIFPKGDEYAEIGFLGEPHELAGDLMGGAPSVRQNRFHSFPPGQDTRKAYPSPRPFPSLLELSLDDQDPLDTSLYSPAMSPIVMSPDTGTTTTTITANEEIQPKSSRSSSSSSSSPPPPPPRPSSPEDLLSPSPSSASTDTSISTPQSPGGSPPLKLYAPYMAGGDDRPDIGSDTYFNFVHRCKFVFS